jgi:hypothetical protein
MDYGSRMLRWFRVLFEESGAVFSIFAEMKRNNAFARFLCGSCIRCVRPPIWKYFQNDFCHTQKVIDHGAILRWVRSSAMDGLEWIVNPVKDLFAVSDGRLSQPILSKERILHAQTAVQNALRPSVSHRYQYKPKAVY